MAVAVAVTLCHCPRAPGTAANGLPDGPAGSISFTEITYSYSFTEITFRCTWSMFLKESLTKSFLVCISAATHDGKDRDATVARQTHEKPTHLSCWLGIRPPPCGWLHGSASKRLRSESAHQLRRGGVTSDMAACQLACVLAKPISWCRGV